jgi:heme A synthase
MLAGAFASPETRIREVVIFGVVMTVFCVGLFKYALGLPIPVAPWLIGY